MGHATKVQPFYDDPPKKPKNEHLPPYNEEVSKVWEEELKVWQSRFGKFSFCDWISWFMWVNFPNIAGTAAFYGKNNAGWTRK